MTVVMLVVLPMFMTVMVMIVMVMIVMVMLVKFLFIVRINMICSMSMTAVTYFGLSSVHQVEQFVWNFPLNALTDVSPRWKELFSPAIKDINFFWLR